MTDQAEHTNLCQEKKSRRTSIRIENPNTFFAKWAYSIERHHFKYLGMEYREFVVKKVSSPSWAIWEPVTTDIPEGTVFYARDDTDVYMQVLSDWDAFRVEVHTGHLKNEQQRSAWAVKHAGIADWLRTGNRPVDSLSIDQSNSTAGTLAWFINRSTTPQTENYEGQDNS